MGATDLLRLSAAATVALLPVSCAQQQPADAPARSAMPTPTTVTRDNPGGDAPDPFKAALIRLLSQPFGTKTDKPKTLRARFPDWRNWRRIRYIGYPSRAGFRYGDDHYAVGIIIFRPAKKGDTPETCLRRYLKEAKTLASDYSLQPGTPRWETGVHNPRSLVLGLATPPHRHRQLPSQHRVRREMPIVRVDGTFVTVANQDRYLAAFASYNTWPGTCLVQGFAVEAGDHEDLAAAVIDRWVREGAGYLIWTRKLQEVPPFANR